MLLLSSADLLLGEEDDANDHDEGVEEGTKKAQVEVVGKDRERKSRALAENLMAGGCSVVSDYFLCSSSMNGRMRSSLSQASNDKHSKNCVAANQP